MNVHLLITAPWKRLRKAARLPQLQCSELEATHWRTGWWQGIAIGFVIGAGLMAAYLA